MRSFVVLSVCVLVSAGCGGADEKGPSRYRVSGTVKFDGKPIPSGTIYFETSAGPAGVAAISKGKYDTDKGKGVIGGPHKVLIEGYDGQAVNPGEKMGKPIFKPYRVEALLPKDDSKQDYNVPASAAEGLVIENDPA